MEDQDPVFISPRKRVTQLYPQALGSLFVASYDSQDYEGDIRTASTRGDPRIRSLHIVSGRTPQKTPLLAVALLQRDLAAEADRLQQFFYCWVRKRGCGHVTLTEPLVSHEESFPVKLFRLSPDMPQYYISLGYDTVFYVYVKGS
jgi:hypothetical protein